VPDVNHLVSHWTDLTDWSPGRSLFACYLTFGPDPAMAGYAGRFQRALADVPEMDPIPHRWLHLTVQGIGFSDTLRPGQAEQVTEAIRDRLAAAEPVAFTVHRPVISTDAVYLPARPAAPLAALREAVREDAAAVMAPAALYPLPGQEGRFHPHVSLAYATAGVPVSVLRGRLDRVVTEPLTVSVADVSLIDLRRDDRRWAWTQETRIPLGARPAPSEPSTPGAVVPARQRTPEPSEQASRRR